MKVSENDQRINTKTITKTSTANYYGKLLAQALILYADQNKEFKIVLSNYISNINIDARPLKEIKIDRSVVLLLPNDSTSAVCKAEYLVKGITDNSLLGAKEAAQVLKSYVMDRPLVVPKQLIIGIVGLAIIGPTLGLISKKKTMIAIVNKKLQAKTGFKMASKTSSASHSVLKQALTMADGNLRQLDPDMADWFFGEKHIAFYSASSKKIYSIEKELKSLGIPYSLEYIEGKPVVLAISPAVSSDYSELYWELERAR